MKKTLGALFCGLALLAGTGAALAGGGDRGGFHDRRRPPLVSVAEARRMRDDSPVRLEGYILRRTGDEKYVFADKTGRIRVEIDEDQWREKVTPQDLVILWGEVERDDGRVEIDVKRIRRR